MRSAARLLVLIAIVAGAAPAVADHGVFHPNLVRERVWFHCAGADRSTDNTLSPRWNRVAPNLAFVGSASGCRLVDVGGQRDATQGTTLDATWRGTYTGNLDSLTIDVHNVNAGRSRLGGVMDVHVRLSVDGKPVLTDGAAHGRFVKVVPTEANSGVTYAVRFSITDIGMLSEVDDKEHEVVLTLAADTDHESVWTYDSTEVPSGLFFNPHWYQLEGTRISAKS